MKIKLLITLSALSCLMIISHGYANDFDPLKGVERYSPSNWKKDVNIYDMNKIDRISKDTIVIDDVEYKLSSDIKYYHENGTELDKTSFSVGTTIIFVIKSGKRDTIVSIIKSQE